MLSTENDKHLLWNHWCFFRTGGHSCEGRSSGNSGSWWHPLHDIGSLDSQGSSGCAALSSLTEKVYRTVVGPVASAADLIAITQNNAHMHSHTHTRTHTHVGGGGAPSCSGLNGVCIVK